MRKILRFSLFAIALATIVLVAAVLLMNQNSQNALLVTVQVTGDTFSFTPVLPHVNKLIAYSYLVGDVANPITDPSEVIGINLIDSETEAPILRLENAYAPVWSPNGTKLAFFSYESGASLIYMLDLVTGEGEALDEGYAPKWSPDGQWISYYNLGLHVINVDTGEIKMLGEVINLADPYFGYDWSPDSMNIVASASDIGEAGFDLFNIASGNWQFISMDRDAVFSLDWSPGDRIAFSVKSHECDNEMYLFQLSPETVTAYTDDCNYDDQPVWSPNGRLLAFISDQGGNELFGISILDIESNMVRRLDILNTQAYRLNWSPNSQWLVYQTLWDVGNIDYVASNVHRVNVNSEEVQQLTDNDYFDGYPVWQP